MAGWMSGMCLAQVIPGGGRLLGAPGEMLITNTPAHQTPGATSGAHARSGAEGDGSWCWGGCWC
jgi:hypothetical protein